MLLPVRRPAWTIRRTMSAGTGVSLITAHGQDGAHRLEDFHRSSPSPTKGADLGTEGVPTSFCYGANHVDRRGFSTAALWWWILALGAASLPASRGGRP